MYLKKEQPTFVRWRSGLPSWLSGEHLRIMTLIIIIIIIIIIQDGIFAVSLQM